MREQVVGVIDLQRGRAVRGVGGHRDRYQPVVLTGPTADGTNGPPPDGSDPLTLAQFYLDRGLGGLYVADLDALTGRPRQTAWLERLAGLGAPIWIDAGFCDGPEAAVAAWPRSLRHQRQIHWILATEAIGIAPSRAARWLEVFPADQITISIDLVGGRLLLPTPFGDVSEPQPKASPEQAGRTPIPPQVPEAGSAVASAGLPDVHAACSAFYAGGARSFLVLDLGAVGGGEGPEHLPICQNLKESYPEATLLSGGGVRNEADLAALLGAGVDMALVASALQTGAIFPSPGPRKD